MTNNPLTPAELAAAEALAGHQIEYIDEESGFDCSCDEHGDLPPMPFRSDAEQHQARAVVAAVHDLIAAETLDRFADKLDALPPGGEALSGPYWYRDGLRDAASMARLDAESSRILSRPTSEEH
jgi:hypothetical protein